MDKMQLKLNLEKTEYILFGSKHTIIKAEQELLRAGPDLIEQSEKVKYLGEVLDNTLNYKSHVSLKVQKAIANFIKIKSICKYITKEPCTHWS